MMEDQGNDHITPCSFFRGESFTSFAALEKKLIQYKEENNCELYTWDSVTISTAVKRGIKIPIISELKYYYVKYACVRGGKKFEKRGKGMRDTRFVHFFCLFFSSSFLFNFHTHHRDPFSVTKITVGCQCCPLSSSQHKDFI